MKHELNDVVEPKRIQRKRTKGWKMPPNTVYVGRPTKWGNPWTLENVSVLRSNGRGGIEKAGEPTREMCVRLYHDDILDGSIGLSVNDIKAELRGKDLACWCRIDDPCHADILLELANAAETLDTIKTGGE